MGEGQTSLLLYMSLPFLWETAHLRQYVVATLLLVPPLVLVIVLCFFICLMTGWIVLSKSTPPPPKHETSDFPPQGTKHWL